MSLQLISRNPDLSALCNDGYDVDIKAAHLLLRRIPYVNSQRQVRLGTLVCPLDLAGDITQKPATHQAWFAGDHPCRSDGTPIPGIVHSSERQTLANGVVVDHAFSAMPKAEGGYRDFHHKMSHYATVISAPAREIDPKMTAQSCLIVAPPDEVSVFNYLDTASSRAGIQAVTAKLESKKIAIVGLGGTGAYVLDLVAKTPVAEIHLYDGDVFANHNAFRSPGAASIDELRERLPKVVYLKLQYSRMHRRITEHVVFVDAQNAEQLRGCDFVFICIDRGSVKASLIERMEHFGISFIDVGMGVEPIDDRLRGSLRVTLSTPGKRDHVARRVSFADHEGDNAYESNIQIADLNALNAALAVVKWKKHFGIYQDLEREHCSAYTINGNAIANEDAA